MRWACATTRHALRDGCTGQVAALKAPLPAVVHQTKALLHAVLHVGHQGTMWRTLWLWQIWPVPRTKVFRGAAGPCTYEDLTASVPCGFTCSVQTHAVCEAGVLASKLQFDL